MHPLLTLWLLVLVSAVLLSGVFYMAENYSHIIGNFYVLIGVFFALYALYFFISWLADRHRKKSADKLD